MCRIQLKEEPWHLSGNGCIEPVTDGYVDRQKKEKKGKGREWEGEKEQRRKEEGKPETEHTNSPTACLSQQAELRTGS